MVELLLKLSIKYNSLGIVCAPVSKVLLFLTKFRLKIINGTLTINT